ncbi:MAG TPA: response regulator [Rhizomicrobium sp.]|nr:response regulator [Rhizomicrobium sp.]
MGDVVESPLEDVERKPAVLVAEDEVMVRTVIAEYLRDAGFTVVEAANAAEAMALLASEVQVDIVFSDIQMGDGMDGLALADWIDAHCPGLPVLLTSGAFLPLGRESERPFISKPYIYLQLEQRLRELIAQTRSRASAAPTGL